MCQNPLNILLKKKGICTFKTDEGLEASTNILHQLLYYLPSAIFLKINNDTYHLSHGAFVPKHANKNSKLKRFLKSEDKFHLVNDETFKFTESDFSKTPMNNLQWGDFYQQLSGANKGQGGRTRFGSDITDKYLLNNGIVAILSGHQDAKNLLLMIRPDLHRLGKYPIGFIHPDEYKKYDLYLHAQTKEEEEYYFTPYKDFIALVTSSAKVAKGLCCDSYLVLKAKPEESKRPNIPPKPQYLGRPNIPPKPQYLGRQIGQGLFF